MLIRVNGEDRDFPDGATVSDVVKAHGLTGRACAVEVNRELAPKARHGDWPLKDGDEVEIVTLVGGG